MSLRLRTRLRDAFRSLTGANDLAIAALTLPVGQISLDEARFLCDLVSHLHRAGPIIEIGTLFGFSTRVMTLAKAQERELITVDSYVWNPLALPPDLHRQCTEKALAEAVRTQNVHVIALDKNAFFAGYRGPSPSMVFLDAVHSYEETTKDLVWARQVGADVICAHDYSPGHPGVVRAVDEHGGVARLVGTLAVLRLDG